MKYFLLLILLVAFVAPGSAQSPAGKSFQNVLAIGPLGTAPSHFYINTKIPFTPNTAPQVHITGYMYSGSNKAFDVTLGWYMWNDQFHWSRFHSAFGFATPTRIRLGTYDDAGTQRVRIEISNESIYWTSYFVSVTDAIGDNSYYTGWTYEIGEMPAQTGKVTEVAMQSTEVRIPGGLVVDNNARIGAFMPGESTGYKNAGAALRLVNGNIYNTEGAAISQIAFGGMYNPTGTQPHECIYNYIEWSSGWLKIRNNQETKIQIGGGLEWGRQDIYFNPTGGNVGIGTTAPSHKLSVNGAIRAKEVIVDTGWSDYVFAKDYKLASLSEVEQHIEQQGHLPGVPSAKEVAEKGVSVGDMQALLLAKIEELTLHQIAQEKELTAQRAKLLEVTVKLEVQANEIARLNTENARLKVHVK